MGLFGQKKRVWLKRVIESDSKAYREKRAAGRIRSASVRPRSRRWDLKRWAKRVCRENPPAVAAPNRLDAIQKSMLALLKKPFTNSPERQGTGEAVYGKGGR